jgi:hypothetical protein
MTNATINIQIDESTGEYVFMLSGDGDALDTANAMMDLYSSMSEYECGKVTIQ